YRPPTTSLSVGATGAGVPIPSATKRAKASRSTAAPAATAIQPMTWSHAGAPADCHRLRSQGTRPATTPGARTRKSRLPTAARTRPTRAFCASHRHVVFADGAVVVAHRRPVGG